jgi:hypothetical protein
VKAAAAKPGVDEIVISGDRRPWSELGFDVHDGRVHVGRVRLRLEEGEREGIVSWSLRGVAGANLDGLPTELSGRGPAHPGRHPNGAVGIDHVVATTPDLERTIAALESAGVRLRRVREAGENRQAFFRLGEVILELVGGPGIEGAARFWGIVFVVEDLDACARLLGDRLGEAHEAVQPGRRIASVRRAAGLPLPVAFITPDPR